MSGQQNKQQYCVEQFDFNNLDEELVVDKQCRGLLHQFYIWLLKQQGKDAAQASELTYCVDYYLRDYLMDTLCRNIVRLIPGLIRCFGGTWYIIRNMEPDYEQLLLHLEGITAWYRFLHQLELISIQELAVAESETAEAKWFKERIDNFNNLESNGYEYWEKQCSLNELINKGNHR